MRILFCCGENLETKEYSSHESFIRAFKDLGHDVVSCGPILGIFEGELNGSLRDIKLHDKRTHPETWTYDEILDKVDKKPDLIIQTDPSFYLVGDKPKNILSAYYIVDAHRGASVSRRMALAGSFDFIFVGHKYFIPHYERVGLNCFWLPRAFDDTYIKEYNDIDVECDISFSGENGLHENINKFNMYDEKIGLIYHTGRYPIVSPENRYRSWDNHSMEYAERAEILYRLSADFNVRVYRNTPNSRGPNYSKIINRAKIIVNHSLWKDSALRNFEVLASNRFLISDMIPFQDELLIDKMHYRSFNQSFSPYLENFNLEYEEIKELVEYYLNNEEERKEITQIGRDFVFKYHTFKNRAQTVIDTINGSAYGYIRQF